MKLIIQIPCFNEEQTLPETLADLPREIPGIDEVEWLVIDDGSTDRTVEVARAGGVDHIVRLTNNKGLAAGFQAGLDACLKLGADVIVNTDADNQYVGADIPKLVAPILDGQADMVVGDRETDQIEHFSPLKKMLQRWAARSCGGLRHRRARHHLRLPRLQPRGRAADPGRLQVHLHARVDHPGGKMLVAVDHVPVRTNPKTRESRLFPSTARYVRRNSVSIFRIYALYEPLRLFLAAAAVAALVGAVIWARFLWFFIDGKGGGHIQSLILGVDPVHRRRAVRRARRGRRHPGRLARAPAAHPRARPAHGAAPGRGALALRAGREPTGQEATTGAQAGRATGKTEDREALKL